jgi:hypothetical protein
MREIRKAQHCLIKITRIKQCWLIIHTKFSKWFSEDEKAWCALSRSLITFFLILSRVKYFKTIFINNQYWCKELSFYDTHMDVSNPPSISISISYRFGSVLISGTLAQDYDRSVIVLISYFREIFITFQRLFTDGLNNWLISYYRRLFYTVYRFWTIISLFSI